MTNETTKTQLPEAGGTAFTNVKSPEGFEWSFTIRDESGTELLKKIQAAQTWFGLNSWEAMPMRATYNGSSKGGASSNGYAKKPSSPGITTTCSICGGPATERRGISKKGKPWHGVFCSSDENHTQWL